MESRNRTSVAPPVGSVVYVVPTLGQRRDYLVETLNSLTSQDHPNLSVVVVAPAGSEHVRTEAARRDVHFLEQRGSGISGAINQGWQAFGARHEFWAWLGDDDMLVPGSARRAVGFLQDHPKASMVYGQCAYVDDQGRLLHVVRPTSLAGLLLRWGPNLVPQPGSVARADAVRNAGVLDENLRYAMDLEFFLRLKDVGPVRYLPEVLATFRWHEHSTTVSSSEASEAEARAVRARTWTGRRTIGRATDPLAHLAGRLLHRLQRGL